MIDHRNTAIINPDDFDYGQCEICRVRQASIWWLSPDQEMELTCPVCSSCYDRLRWIDDFGHA
jgi:hypothetical protein